jgi:hypothetical protein
MAPAQSSPANFATANQLLLLRGALCEPEEAATAAGLWFRSEQAATSGRRFERLESGSRRLLPLVYHNVKESLSPDLRERLKAVHLEYWAGNQKLFGGLETTLLWFQANHIPTLVLKGVALSHLHYGNNGMRPTCDADVLIPEAQAADVMSRLLREGWTSEYLSSSPRKNSYVYRHIHGLPFSRTGCGSFDLHWHALHVATFQGADFSFWIDSVPLRVKSIETRALNPSDQLLHVCVHGFARNVVAPIRWIADAITVLRTSSIDWNRVLHVARELRVTVPLSLTLSFLNETFRADIPGDVLGELTASAVVAEDWRYFNALNALATVKKHWGRVARYHYEKQKRMRHDLHPILRLALLPHDLGAYTAYQLGWRMNRRSGHA